MIEQKQELQNRSNSEVTDIFPKVVTKPLWTPDMKLNKFIGPIMFNETLIKDTNRQNKTNTKPIKIRLQKYGHN